MGLLLSLLLATQMTFAADLTVDQKVNDMDQLLSSVKSGYGPLQYKRTLIGMDVDGLRAKYLPLVQASKTNGEFYYQMVQMVAEFKDSHFSASVPTEHVVSVPFTTDLVAGHVVIDSINREKLTKEAFSFERGDEILSVNGVPIKDVLDELSLNVASGFEQTRRRTAAVLVSTRSGARVAVPKGDVEFEIRRGDSTIVEKAKLKWESTKTPLDEVSNQSEGHGFERGRFNRHDLSTFDIWAEYVNPLVEKSYRCSPTTRIEKPAGFTKIMDEPFVAYYYPTAKGNVGYLRIPHYYWKDDFGKDLNSVRLEQYRWAVSELEKNTVGLIIDQDHNCGGSVDLVEQMVGLFMDKPFAPLTFQFLANKEMVLDLQKDLK